MNTAPASTPISTRREWSSNGQTFGARGIYCTTPGARHVWVEMGRDANYDVFACDVCACFSRTPRLTPQ